MVSTVFLRTRSCLMRFVKDTFQEWMQEFHSQIERFQRLMNVSFYGFLFLSKAKNKKMHFQNASVAILT
jgi:hypothetical protein